jgi:hypothetical protein
MALKMKRFPARSAISAFLIVSVSSLLAEEPDRPLWQWSPAKPHHSSVVMIRVGGDLGDWETGTGVVIHVDRDSPEEDGYLGFVATASHLFGSRRSRNVDQKEIRVFYANAAQDVSRECSIVRREDDLDVAILWVWIPKDVAAARLARRSAERGDPVEFVGLGGKGSLDEGLRHFTASASAPTDEERIYADQPLLPGDSGGPIFDGDGKLLGIISGGWFWWSHETMRTRNDQPLRATWPARGSNIYPLALLIADLPRNAKGNCSASKSKRRKFKEKDGMKIAAMPVPRPQRQQMELTAVEPVIVEATNEWVPSVEGEIIYESVLPEEVIEYEYAYPGS